MPSTSHSRISKKFHPLLVVNIFGDKEKCQTSAFIILLKFVGVWPEASWTTVFFGGRKACEQASGSGLCEGVRMGFGGTVLHESLNLGEVSKAESK